MGVCIASCANAQVDNLSNLSAEWLRTGARNAATNATDIVAYNPAGLTKLESGLHINVSNQSLFRLPSHTYDLNLGEGVKTFSQNGSDPFLPALYFSFNKNKCAFFGGVYVAGGGATMNYPAGSLTTDLISLQALMSAGGAYMTASNQSLKASSFYMTYMAGVAYAATNKISFSFALRNISANNKAEGGMTLTNSPFDFPDMPLALEYKENASGIGAVAGLNISCSEKFNLSARYESKVNLDFTTKQIKDDFGLTTDGQKNRRDLPAVAGMGACFKPSENVSAYVDFNYYFQKNADWGKSTLATNEEPLSSLAGNVYSIGFGTECRMTPKITGSIGGGFTNYIYNDRAGYYTHMGTFEVIQDDNVNINTGFAFEVSKKMKVNAGYMHTFWKKDQIIKALIAQPLDVDVKVNNNLNAVAFGVELAF